MKPLVIWDFDGVIADSEKLWVKVWRDLLKQEKGIVLTKEEELKLLVGVADRTKKHNLQRRFPSVQFDADFMQKILDGETYAGVHYMKAIPGVKDVFADDRFLHCIATGGTREQHLWKMTILKWIHQYIDPKDAFTVDMVKHGKPAPDLFLLAAHTKHHRPDQCVVVEDSLNGIQAAKTAGMKCIAFVGAEGNNTPDYRQKCLDAGADVVCQTMPQVHQAIQDLFA